MRVVISYTYKEDMDEFNHVINIQQHFDYKLGASMVLMIEGKRNRKRIPLIDVKHVTVLG